MNDLALIEMGIVILVAAGGGAVAYGMLRQQVLGNRRDLDKLDQRIIKLDDDQGETNVELFKLLHAMNRNLHRLMGKLNIEPVD